MAVGVASVVAGSLLPCLGEVLGYAGIFAGRVFTGVAVGIAKAVGTTWVAELSRGASGGRRATVALTSGFALGAAAGGVLAEVSSPALVWPYVARLAVAVPALVAVTTLTGAETSEREAGPRPWPSRLAVPSATNRRFLRAVRPMAPWIFGSAGIACAIVPQGVGSELGDWGLLFTAAVTGATLGMGISVQPFGRRLDDASTARAVDVAMVLMSSGVVMAAAVALVSPVLAAPTVLPLGAAYGIVMVSGLLEVQRIAPEGELAGLAGIYYAVAYLGFLLPAVLAVAAELISWATYPTMLACVAVLTVVCTAVCLSGWARHLPPRRAG